MVLSSVLISANSGRLCGSTSIILEINFNTETLFLTFSRTFATSLRIGSYKNPNPRLVSSMKSNDAVFFRTDPILCHKFVNMVIFRSGNLYSRCSPGNQDYQKIIHFKKVEIDNAKCYFYWN